MNECIQKIKYGYFFIKGNIVKGSRGMNLELNSENNKKTPCIFSFKGIEYSVNIKSDEQEKYMMQGSPESNRLLGRLRYRMMERHL